MERQPAHSLKRLIGLMAAMLLLTGITALAQGSSMMQGHAYFSGPVTDIAADSVTVQGATLALVEDTTYIGEDGSGNLVTLTAADFNVGDTVTAFAEYVSGTQTATAIYRGLTFMVFGTVTDVQTDDQGVLQVVVIDGTYTVHVAQATFDAMASGDMGNGMSGGMMGGMASGGMMGGGMGSGGMGGGSGTGGGMGGGSGTGGGMGGGMGHVHQVVAEDGNASSLVQIGSTVVLGGLVNDGLYAAVFGHVMGSDMMGGGTIQSVSRSASGEVTSFVMTSSGSSRQVMVTGSTEITKKKQTMPSSALQGGMKVSVSGLSVHNGTVVANSIQIKGGMR